MKMTVWVLATCIPGEPEPCQPNVYGSRAAAEAGFDEMMRAEWDSNTPENDVMEPLPYPTLDEEGRIGDPDAAQDALKEWLGNEWGRWQLTSHQIEMPVDDDKIREAILTTAAALR
jgi:hypothetical protein